MRLVKIEYESCKWIKNWKENIYFRFIRYEKSSRFMKVGYERDFLRYLQSLLAEVERRIRRGHARLALSQNQQSSGVSMN